MREYFSCGDLANKAKLTRQHIWNLWMDGKLPATLLKAGSKQLRFKKTPALEAWCVKSASNVEERLRKRQAREYRHWTKDHADLLSRLVTKEKPRLHCDLSAWRMWKGLTVRYRLTPSELNESLRRGYYVAKKKRDYGNVAGGVPTFQGIEMEWKLLRRQLGRPRKSWTGEQIDQALKALKNITSFVRQLRCGDVRAVTRESRRRKIQRASGRHGHGARWRQRDDRHRELFTARLLHRIQARRSGEAGSLHGQIHRGGAVASPGPSRSSRPGSIPAPVAGPRKPSARP